MKKEKAVLSRRTFLKGSMATIGLSSVSVFPFKNAFGDDYPSRAIDIVVPTRAGGGADRNLRAFTGVWKKYLKNGL